MIISKRLKKDIKKKLPLWIASVVIAIIAWFLISILLYPTVSMTFADVELSTDITGSSASANGFVLINLDVNKVTVRLEGNRAEIGDLKSGDLEAKLVVNNVTSRGSRQVEIEVISKSGKKFYVKEITPKIALVTFDKYETREFTLTPKMPNLNLTEHKRVDHSGYTCEPSTILIKGPSAQLDKIERCDAIVNSERTLESSERINCDEIKFYSSDNSPISGETLTVLDPNVVVNIPVVTVREAMLNVQFVGAPSNFEKSILKYTLSADTITLASPSKSYVEMPTSLDIGPIRLSDLDLNYSNTLQINISSPDLINFSKLDSVTFTLDKTNLAQRVIDVNKFEVTNGKDTALYDYKVNTTSLPVTIIGPSKMINDITADDIVAYVDLLSVDPLTDVFSYSVTYSFPKHSQVWAVGNSSVWIQRKLKR